MALDLPSYLLGRRSGSKGALVPIVVEELPESGESGKLYLVPRQVTETNNVFDEYIWVDESWELIGTAEIDISGKQDKMQYTSLPTASATNLGQIYQYVGSTNANYTQGYFYICVSDGLAPATYSWVNVDIQDTSDKLNTSAVKTSLDTTAGNVYDVTYINGVLGDIDTALSTITTGTGV